MSTVWPKTAADKQVVKDEKAATERQAAREVPWVADVTDHQYPPSDARNRGNLDYKPAFEGEIGSKEADKALKAMVTGEYKLPVGTFDNVLGNKDFQAPNVINPVWRWDATGRQSQWVRP